MLSNKPIRKYLVTARRMQLRDRDIRGAWSFVQTSEHIADVTVDTMGRRNVAWVVERILRNEAAFFMYVGLRRAVLRVVQEGPTPFLRAECEDDGADHLLALPVVA